MLQVCAKTSGPHMLLKILQAVKVLAQDLLCFCVFAFDGIYC